MRNRLHSHARHAPRLLAVLGVGVSMLVRGEAGPVPAEPVLVSVGPTEVAELVRNGGGPVLVNVWATWCVPCREEFPDLLRLRRAHRAAGLRVILVSADFDRQRAQALQFLASQGVDFVSYLKSGDDAQFIDALSPQWSGALPATFVFDGSGRLAQWWEGKASYERLEEAVRAVMRGTAGGATR